MDKKLIAVSIYCSAAIFGTSLFIFNNLGFFSGSNLVPRTEKTVETLEYKVDINNANERELENLPGIGPSLSKRIIEYRNAHGKILSLGELEAVSGISKNNLEKIKPYLTL